jgi:hypothetical protein
MIPATNHRPIGECNMLGVGLSRAVYGGENLVPPVFYIRRTVCFVQDTHFKLERSQLVESSPVDAKTFVVN